MPSKQNGKSITIWSDGIITIEFFLLTAIEIYFGYWAGMRCFGYFGGFPAGKNIFLFPPGSAGTRPRPFPGGFRSLRAVSVSFSLHVFFSAVQ